MGLLLNIDTATEICSVCLSKNGEIIANKEDKSGNNHSKVLSVLIQDVFNEAQQTIEEIDAVAISQGPGSYTGLRIGTATAKGICFGLGKPLIALDTLQCMAWGYAFDNQHVIQEEDLLCPMIDARRMEVYTAIFSNKLMNIEKTHAKIIDEYSFLDLLDKQRIHFFGNGSEKCKSVLSHSNAIFTSDFSMSSCYMPALSEIRNKTQYYADVAYFEPQYLKDFIATKPKKNIFK